MLPRSKRLVVPLIWSVLAAFGAALHFGIALAFSVGPDGWPAVENPPKQGEAMTVVDGNAVYSPSALARTIREPQATWSSFAFVAVAAWIFERFREPVLRGIIAPLFTLAVGAALYHASGTREWRHLDIAGLYWVYATLAWIAARELVPRSAAGWMSRHPAVACLSLGVLAAALTAGRNLRIFDLKPLHVTVMTTAVGIFAGAALLLICWKRSEPRRWVLGIVSIAALVVGALLQIGDRPGNLLCNPDGLFQAHAWWHVLGALSVALAVEAFAEADVEST